MVSFFELKKVPPLIGIALLPMLGGENPIPYLLYLLSGLF